MNCGNLGSITVQTSLIDSILVMVFFISISRGKVKYDSSVTKLALFVLLFKKGATIIPIFFRFLLYYVFVHVFNLILLENTELKITVFFLGDFPHLSMLPGEAEGFLLS